MKKIPQYNDECTVTPPKEGRHPRFLPLMYSRREYWTDTAMGALACCEYIEDSLSSIAGVGGSVWNRGPFRQQNRGSISIFLDSRE